MPMHGVGNRQDLPLPFGLLLVGAALALVISFVALGLLWRTPRVNSEGGIPLPATISAVLGSRALRGMATAVVLTLTALLWAALSFGSDLDTNPSAYLVFVWMWIGIGFLSILIGPFWTAVNPMRLLHLGVCRLARVDPDQPAVDATPGYWPAAITLFGFVWLELIAPERTGRETLGIATIAFVAITVVGSTTLGRAWFARGDPFEVWSRLLGALSPLGRRTDGTWVLRTPLHGVEAIPLDRGLLATASVMLGSTAYDGFSNEPVWFRAVQTSSAPSAVVETAGLVGFCVVIAGSMSLAVWVAARLAGRPSRGVANAFAPSLVPIAAGYVVAHYWSLGVYEGQHTFALISDPLGTGANLFGTGGLVPSSTLIAPRTVAVIQVVAIVLGHVLGVVSSHERALRLFDRRTAVVGQVPLLVLMVGYTCGGLFLLFSS